MTVELDRKVHELLGHCCHELHEGVSIASEDVTTISGDVSFERSLSYDRRYLKDISPDMCDKCVLCGASAFDVFSVGKNSVPSYSSDLNLAWPLMFDAIKYDRDKNGVEKSIGIEDFGVESIECPQELARGICETFVLVKSTISVSSKVQEGM